MVEVITNYASVVYKTTSGEAAQRAVQGPTNGPPTFGRNGKYSLVSYTKLSRIIIV